MDNAKSPETKTQKEERHIKDLTQRAEDPAELSRMVQTYGPRTWQGLKRELDDLKKPESGVSQAYNNCKMELDSTGNLKHLEFESKGKDGKDRKVVYDLSTQDPDQTAKQKTQQDNTNK